MLSVQEINIAPQLMCHVFILTCLSFIMVFLWYKDHLNKTLELKRVIFIVFLFGCNFVVSYGLCGFSLETVTLRLIYGLVVLMFIRWITPIVTSNPLFTQILRDQTTIVTHWKDDEDLSLLTMVLRAFRVFSATLFCVGIYLFPVGLNAALPDLLVSTITPTEFFLTPGPLCIIIAVLIWLIVEIIQLMANLHVVWYRNNPTVHKFWNTCIECAKSASVIGGGVIMVGGAGIQALSSSPFVEPTTIGNSWQIYVGRGYGFSDQLVHKRHVILMACPNYNPLALADEQGMLTHEAQKDFIRNNSEQVCRNTSLTQRQMTNIQPTLGGLIKSYL